MCTGFAKKGDDFVIGFNFDADTAVWPYRLFRKKDLFCVGIKAGSKVYKVHGVTRSGNFGCLPYMNAPEKGVCRRGSCFQRIDLLCGEYISGKCSYADLLETLGTKTLVNAAKLSMHSLFCDGDGHMLLAEPGSGCKEFTGDHAVIANFPLLERPEDMSPVWYGADRYEKAEKTLCESGADFSAADGLRLLESVKQEGAWATRVSFVYSRRENAVYYCLEGDFSNIQKHEFA